MNNSNERLCTLWKHNVHIFMFLQGQSFLIKNYWELGWKVGEWQKPWESKRVKYPRERHRYIPLGAICLHSKELWPPVYIWEQSFFSSLTKGEGQLSSSYINSEIQHLGASVLGTNPTAACTASALIMLPGGGSGHGNQCWTHLWLKNWLASDPESRGYSQDKLNKYRY